MGTGIFINLFIVIKHFDRIKFLKALLVFPINKKMMRHIHRRDKDVSIIEFIKIILNYRGLMSLINIDRFQRTKYMATGAACDVRKQKVKSSNNPHTRGRELGANDF